MTPEIVPKIIGGLIGVAINAAVWIPLFRWANRKHAAQGMEREARKPEGVPVPQDFQARSEGCALNPTSSQGISHE